jgi:hypothetical protein
MRLGNKTSEGKEKTRERFMMIFDDEDIIHATPLQQRFVFTKHQGIQANSRAHRQHVDVGGRRGRWPMTSLVFL